MPVLQLYTPALPPQLQSRKELERYCHIYENRTRRPPFSKCLVPVSATANSADIAPQTLDSIHSLLSSMFRDFSGRTGAVNIRFHSVFNITCADTVCSA